jgi:hypothetical protein
MTAPETMVSWSGTRHLVGTEHRATWGIWFSPVCNTPAELSPDEQDRPHRKDCRRCFPVSTDETPNAALESARSIAAKLEAENAELIAFVEKIATNHWLHWADNTQEEARALLARLNPTGDQS